MIMVWQTNNTNKVGADNVKKMTKTVLVIMNEAK